MSYYPSGCREESIEGWWGQLPEEVLSRSLFREALEMHGKLCAAGKVISALGIVLEQSDLNEEQEARYFKAEQEIDDGIEYSRSLERTTGFSLNDIFGDFK